MPFASGVSLASNRKYPLYPKWLAPASSIVLRERVAIWMLALFPIAALARISPMARSPIAERRTPRISVNDLALYMVSSDTARVGIIRRAKNPSVPPIIRYRDVRPVVCAFLADSTRNVNLLVVAEETFNQRAEDSAVSVLRQDDARNSIEVLHALQGMANQLAPFQFGLAPRRQPKLDLAGVEVSTYADLLVTGRIRGEDHSGAAILRLTQDDAETEPARTKRREMGFYVASLARIHAEQNLNQGIPIANRLCMSIDVQHRECFRSPDSNTRRMNDLENACRFIAAMWDAV